MSRDIFFISDTHFGHSNILDYVDDEGNKIRNHKTTHEMDEALIKGWNSVVKPGDLVYHLGDVTLQKKELSTLYRLHGEKILVKGNHDLFEIDDYKPHFSQIYGVFVLDRDIALTHVPVHTSSMIRFKLNIHGHLHQRIVKDKWDKPDHRYLSVCAERVNYTPIHLDTILNHLKTHFKG